MRKAIQSLNKNSLAQATGISYSRLRKYSSGLLKKLDAQEIAAIRDYLLQLAEKFTNNSN